MNVSNNNFRIGGPNANAQNNLPQNSRMRNGASNGGCSDSESRTRLLQKIQELSFAKTETELYLDAHPDAAVALEYYKDVVKRLGAVMEIYEAKYGPIIAGSESGDTWRWVDDKWPWHYDMEEDG